MKLHNQKSFENLRISVPRPEIPAPGGAGGGSAEGSCPGGHKNRCPNFPQMKFFKGGPKSMRDKEDVMRVIIFWFDEKRG